MNTPTNEEGTTPPPPAPGLAFDHRGVLVPMNTPTPRTDDAALGFARIMIDWNTPSTTELVDANFARQLERDLAAAQEARQAAEALAAQNAKDAERWQLMFGSARVSAVGSAGLGDTSVGNYAHLCLNFWTMHEPATGVEPLAQEWIDGYLTKARAAIAGEKK